jgi:hypothetical protein
MRTECRACESCFPLCLGPIRRPLLYCTDIMYGAMRWLALFPHLCFLCEKETGPSDGKSFRGPRAGRQSWLFHRLVARLLNLLEAFRCPDPYPAKGPTEGSSPDALICIRPLGGTRGCTVLVIRPSRSIWRNVCVSIFWLIPSTDSLRRVNRSSPFRPRPQEPALSTYRLPGRLGR